MKFLAEEEWKKNQKRRENETRREPTWNCGILIPVACGYFATYKDPSVLNFRIIEPPVS
jgi:hypothetical protein